jgi:hypothetical protein
MLQLESFAAAGWITEPLILLNDGSSFSVISEFSGSVVQVGIRRERLEGKALQTPQFRTPEARTQDQREMGETHRNPPYEYETFGLDPARAAQRAYPRS